jgi:hypothetical protein
LVCGKTCFTVQLDGFLEFDAKIPRDPDWTLIGGLADSVELELNLLDLIAGCFTVTWKSNVESTLGTSSKPHNLSAKIKTSGQRKITVTATDSQGKSSSKSYTIEERH